MKAEIISIGTELLFGQIVDTNAAWIASRMPALGIDLYFISTVGDNQGRIVETLRRGWDRSDVIITTGGLGPTEDDLTRESIAELCGEEMKVDPELEAVLHERFRGRTMPARNIKQATLIPSAKGIPNPRGTAPGWWVEKNGKIIASMPGVPPEMFLMWEEQVAPRLLERSDGSVIVSRLLKSNGVGEGQLDEMLSPLLGSTNPTIGVYAKIDGVHVRMSAKASRPEQANALLDEMEPRVAQILGDIIWGRDEDTPGQVVGALLKERGMTLATIESITGGMIASAITDVPGSSAYFAGGMVTYSNDMKALAGVDPRIIEEHGAVSEQTARAMAAAVRKRTGAGIAISTTGVAGPDPLEGKPPGTVFIGLATESDQRVSTGGIVLRNRPDIRQRATANALLFLRRYLLGLD